MTRLASAYRKQVIHAETRGIAWEFTFESWLKVWVDSGRLKQRGRGPGKFCMARNGDVGPYSPENVSIKAQEENSSEAFDAAPYLDRKNCIGRPGTGVAGGRGVYFKGGGRAKPWASRFRNVHLGHFETEEAGRAAYVKAAIADLVKHGKPIPENLK